MIINVPKFISEEQSYWSELEDVLKSLDRDNTRKMDIKEVRRFHYLYQRASADLAKLITFSSQTGVKSYLETLVAKAYCEIHETRRYSTSFSPVNWFLKKFPRTFRAHIKAFYLTVAITLIGALFGGLAITLDPEAKTVLMPFSHLLINPTERVKQEENATSDRLAGHKATFSSYLMTHNTKVAILCMTLGISMGIGTILVIFINGVMLGAVAIDYILAGESVFLMGWLLPHGVIEIPAILLAGQAGFILAGAIIGKGSLLSFRERLELVSKDIVTIIAGTGVLLVWAGIIESFFSQYHEPVIPYKIKIAFGVIELILLIWFLSRAGIKRGNK